MSFEERLAAVLTSDQEPTEIFQAVAPVSPLAMAECYTAIQKWALDVEVVGLNPLDFGDLHKLDEDTVERVPGDPEQLRLWGAVLVPSDMVPQGKVYFLSNEDHRHAVLEITR